MRHCVVAEPALQLLNVTQFLIIACISVSETDLSYLDIEFHC